MLKKQLLFLTAAVLLVPSLALAQVGGQSDIQKEIDARKQQIDALQKKQQEYEAQIAEYRKQASSLNAQVGALNSQISRTNLKLESTKLQIQETQLQIQETEEQVKVKESEISAQRERLAAMLRAVDRLDSRDSIVELVVGNGGLGDTFSELAEFQRVHQTLQGQLDGLQQLHGQLEQQKVELASKNEQLDSFQGSLEEQSDRLSSNKAAKAQILEQTKGSQQKYEALLADLKSQVAQINSEISSYEQRLRSSLQSSGELSGAVGKLAWPVASRTITAYFHDPDYPFRRVFEHPADDIRTPQGTAVHAAADGYVGRVKDGGKKGYSYILLVHAGNLSTVYGHLSRMVVAQDSFVHQGDVIGYSGGTPGTPGAGPLTTGPHLHLEVRLNGIPVDPLDYLQR
jgi:murein DD-endopeptidase MepM/ murein hydrolase activator NlpD